MALNVKILTKDDAEVTLCDLITQVKKIPEIDECGAIFSFEGIVRGKEKDKNVQKLILSTSNIKKTEEELINIIKETKDKYKVAEIAAVHYIGEFYTGDSLLLVVVAGGHREETRDALKETIERIKFDLDFKKEEFTDSGTNIIMSGG
ncbi:MAG: molybdenum cofactor biosynthesis protein MoaE [Methanobacterium sp.]|uniref:molybdenum cofactor biosynthesis protein MoaE n=1 Tax=Methanobacterium sp. TaxID=2164 RepID=UPI003D650A22|nr:molybdenum cofactor biosynthesis protein MoaE [Methanobacterium sp.]